MFPSARFGWFVTAVFLSLLCLNTSQAHQIPARLDESETFSLNGNTRPAVERGLVRDEGRLRGSRKMPRMSLQFSMTPAQQADLAQLLSAQQNRRSPQYHKFLTPEQYAARFAPRSTDIAPIVAWLEGSGFTDVQVARGGMWVNFSGTAAQAESAFHVSLRNYSMHGEMHFANAADPQLPKALAGLVQHVGGLNNFAMKSSARRSHPHFTSSASGYTYLVPDDWATIYDVQPLYGSGLDGSAVTIAVVGQSDVALSDLRAFRAAAGLPAKDPTVIVPPGSLDPGIQNERGDEDESDLDLEWAGAIASNADILFVTASATHGNGIYDSIAYVVDNNAAPIMSISYGDCEADLSAGFLTSEEAIFQQASAEGITVLVASGDTGATTCDERLTEQQATHGLAVAYPASSEYVTAVGGTEFNTSNFAPTNNSHGGSAQSYISEQAWNDGFQYAGGGGASKVLPKPAWQVGLGVPADNARDVPDVAFSASPGYIPYLICSKGWCTNQFQNSNGDLDAIGGTSASTPSFAGFMALILQKGGGGRFGNINPNLYSLAQISPNAFHDITSGSNRQDCQAGTPDCPTESYIGYDAGLGYDQATGLGSIDAFNFAQQWFGDFSVASNPASLTIQPGTSATATVSVVPQNNFNGQVTVTCSVAGTLIDVTCSVPNGPVSAGGTTTVTITAATTAKAPWWKRRSLPPLNWSWLLVAAAILMLSAALYLALQHRPVYQASLYAFASVSLVVIAVGAVSCGGGGPASTISSAPVPTPTPPPPKPAPLLLTCNLPNAAYQASYSGSCSASGGTAPYTYSGSTPPGLTLDTATGAITGTASNLGSYQLTFTVTDSENPPQTATSAAALTVATSPLSISCQLPPALTGVAYMGACTASGGLTPYAFSITSGAPPLGIGLTGTGIMIGTASTTGTASFAITVQDAYPDSQTASFTDNSFVINPGPFAMTCNTPATGVTGQEYSGSCVTTGGTPPSQFSSSVMPAGLSIGSNGFFGGIPLVSGAFSYLVTATDSGSPPQTTQLTQNVNITAGPLSLDCQLGPTFTHFPIDPTLGCTAYGGNAPFKYSVTSGALPPGLTLNSATGKVSGIPTVVGSNAWVFTVTDSSSPAQTATSVYSDYVVQATQPLTFTCRPQDLTGSLSVPFLGTCVAHGGNPPYTPSVISGTLPPGLPISAFYGYDSQPGQIAFFGTPIQMGTSTVTIQLTDGSVPALTATGQATFTIGPRPQESGLVTITAVSGGITNTTTISVSVP